MYEIDKTSKDAARIYQGPKMAALYSIRPSVKQKNEELKSGLVSEMLLVLVHFCDFEQSGARPRSGQLGHQESLKSDLEVITDDQIKSIDTLIDGMDLMEAGDNCDKKYGASCPEKKFYKIDKEKTEKDNTLQR
uniref:Uncharacterized protein n=1 Tax=Timema cristinae TaxID=61476 RepID=A0A7R9CQB7_TIMCR|nr:unnamed protein product [Timema cristinae]